MDGKLTTETTKITSLENLYVVSYMIVRVNVYF